MSEQKIDIEKTMRRHQAAVLSLIQQRNRNADEAADLRVENLMLQDENTALKNLSTQLTNRIAELERVALDGGQRDLPLLTVGEPASATMN